MAYALDVNVLLYASDESSDKHQRARDFLLACAQDTELLCLGWLTVMSYLRMATHPAIFKKPLTQPEALRNVQGLINLPHVRLLSEGDGFWAAYCQVTQEVPARGNLVPDAHLAALLLTHGVKVLYTHDKDFRKFSQLQARDPFQAAG